ncbi:hypothetical protein BGZ99_002142 [Dissophora globulifera]|uniref:t-SNARE coiled-coil homology domain-containing protein n=1 Tax=Dissophora globulifera TaxID=979702 RepID=A0A9P6UXQ2_9FUNG|nr:hypothetical protein BGZ99_002142 [Dissophora globulifera]
MSDREMLSLESQNDDEISGLHSKVAMLKKITMDIGNEVRESTIFVGDLDQDFGRTGGLLNTTYTRLKVMASTQNGRSLGITELQQGCKVEEKSKVCEITRVLIMDDQFKMQ